jgi:hypothetical protein
MFGLDMTLWNRVQYPSRQTVALSVRDTFLMSAVVGTGTLVCVTTVSKIVAMTVGVF